MTENSLTPNVRYHDKVCFNWPNDLWSARIGGLQLQVKTKATFPTLFICGYKHHQGKEERLTS